MLKKAGIIVAASAAALLAVSPLAFAGDKGESHWGHGHGGSDSTQVNSVDDGSHSSGLIAVGDVNALNNINVCPELPVGLGLGNVLGILGSGTATTAPSAGDATCAISRSIGQGNDN